MTITLAGDIPPAHPACADHLDLWVDVEHAIERAPRGAGTTTGLLHLARPALNVCGTCPILGWCATLDLGGAYTGVLAGRVIRGGLPVTTYRVSRATRVRQVRDAQRRHPDETSTQLASRLGLSPAYVRGLRTRPSRPTRRRAA